MARRRGQPWEPVGDENAYEDRRDPQRPAAPGGAPAEFVDTASDDPHDHAPHDHAPHDNLPGDQSEPKTGDADGSRTSSAR